MDFAQYIDIVFVIIVLAAIFLFVKPHRIKALWPVSLVSAIVLFIVDFTGINLGLYKFNNPLFPLAGIPLFHLLWGFFGGIFVVNFVKKEFVKKVLAVLIFTLISGMFGYISENIGGHTHLGSFNELYNFITDFAALSILVWFSDGLFGARIYPRHGLL